MIHQPSVRTAERVFGLDLLRAIAILNVVHLHGYAFVEAKVSLALYALPILADGVGVFFVLSGFLIGSILIKEFESPEFGVAAMRRFWRRRWFRTLPNYFLALAAAAAVSGLAWPELGPRLLRYGLFLQNFFSPHPNFFNEAWSLAVEEWFYLLLPLALLACRSLRPRRTGFLLLIVLGIMLPLVVRVWRWRELGPLSPEEWDLVHRRQVVTQLDSLMFGVAGAWCRFHHPARWNSFARPGLIAALVGLITLKFLPAVSGVPYGFFRQVLYFPAVAACTLLALPFLSMFRASASRLPVRMITRLSVLSYAMYLVNFSLIRNWVLPTLVDHWPSLGAGFPGLGLFWMLTLGLSWVIYAIYETPLTNLRDRFGRAPARS